MLILASVADKPIHPSAEQERFLNPWGRGREFNMAVLPCYPRVCFPKVDNPKLQCSNSVFGDHVHIVSYIMPKTFEKPHRKMERNMLIMVPKDLEMMHRIFFL